jgi:hypothetical protein
MNRIYLGLEQAGDSQLQKISRETRNRRKGPVTERKRRSRQEKRRGRNLFIWVEIG